VDWAADGRSLFVSSQSATSSTLLTWTWKATPYPLGSTWSVANLGDRRAEWPRTRHRRHDKRHQRLDDRKFLTVKPAQTVREKLRYCATHHNWYGPHGKMMSRAIER